MVRVVLKTVSHLCWLPCCSHTNESQNRTFRMKTSNLCNKNRTQQGFTLIELMIVVVVIAILASIALPSYANYVKRSQAKSATADLVALSLNFENHFQRTLNYPAAAASTTTTAATKTLMPGWAPSMGDFFTYSATTTTTTYALTATGTGGMSGCNLGLSNDNVRTVSSASSCGGFSTW